jgi:single-stranded DNA-binding protein
VNAVSLIGTVTRPPDPRAGAPWVRFQLAVPCRSREGRRQPGVIYVDCVLDEREARDCAKQLSTGVMVGLVGRLDVDEQHGPDDRHRKHRVLADQLDYIGRADAAPTG